MTKKERIVYLAVGAFALFMIVLHIWALLWLARHPGEVLPLPWGNMPSALIRLPDQFHVTRLP